MVSKKEENLLEQTEFEVRDILRSEWCERGGPDIALDVWVAKQQEALSGSGTIQQVSRLSKLGRVDEAL